MELLPHRLELSPQPQVFSFALFSMDALVCCAPAQDIFHV